MPRCAPEQLFAGFPRPWLKPLFLAAICLLLFLPCGCTTPPGVTVTTVDVVEVGSDSSQVAIRIQLSNPTKVPIRIDTWMYSMSVRGEKVYSGDWVSSITIPPESRLLTAIPAVVPMQSKAGPDSRWSVDGSVRYLETTRFSQLLYDLGLNRPTTPLSASGSGMGSGGTIPSAG